jgi:hypothetical protein
MTFIGIVIFTVHFPVSVWHMDSDCLREKARCQDSAHAFVEDTGRYEPRYVGEFKTLDECDAAAGKVKYKTKAGERVEELVEVLCVPKDPSTPTGK